MQRFSADQKFAADATMILKKFYNFFAPGNMKKHPQKLLIIGPDPFFQYCQLTQIQSKSQFLFHKNLPPWYFSIVTLSRPEEKVITRMNHNRSDSYSFSE